MAGRDKSAAGRTRITGGRMRGRVLTVGPGVRPTEAKVREALFSIWGQLLPGSSFLDLFAGSGAVGLEAASRGAREVWLVEGSARVARLLEANVEAVKAPGCRVVRADLPAGLGRFEARLQGRRFDLIFADPPYAFDHYEQVLAVAAELLVEEGRLAIEHARRREMPSSEGVLERIDEGSYGDKVVSFYGR